MRRGMPIRTFTARSSPWPSRSSVRSARTFPTLSRRIAILQFYGIREAPKARPQRTDPPAQEGVARWGVNGRTFFGAESERIGRMLLRLGLLLLGAALVFVCAPAHAQASQSKVVVFVPPRELDAPLRDALTAHLSDVDAELVIEHFVSATESLKHDVDESRSLAAAHQAVGVFWLDIRSKDEWRVFLSHPADSRVLMRRIPLGPEGVAAAVEAVAVITKEST